VAARKKLWGLFRRGESEPSSSEDVGKDAAPAQFSLRRYQRRDRRAVLRISAETFHGVCMDENIERDFGKTGGTWQQHKMDSIDYDLTGNPASCFVAEADGKIVGFICNRLYHNRSIGHVANLAVREDYQGRGIGKALLQASLDHFREMGMRFARIETLAQNEKGQKFYPAAGFKEIGRQIFYFTKL